MQWITTKFSFEVSYIVEQKYGWKNLLGMQSSMLRITAYISVEENHILEEVSN
jgi:hypothetical protein